MAIVSIDARDRTPIYAQLERALRAAVATGRLQPGDQLPTVRQLAVDLSVNANTVARVYAELERAGVIETRRGGGLFVCGTAARAHPPREHDRRLRAFITGSSRTRTPPGSPWKMSSRRSRSTGPSSRR